MRGSSAPLRAATSPRPRLVAGVDFRSHPANRPSVDHHCKYVTFKLIMDGTMLNGGPGCSKRNMAVSILRHTDVRRRQLSKTNETDARPDSILYLYTHIFSMDWPPCPVFYVIHKLSVDFPENPSHPLASWKLRKGVLSLSSHRQSPQIVMGQLRYLHVASPHIHLGVSAQNGQR